MSALANTFQLTQNLDLLKPGDDFITLISSWVSKLDGGAGWLYEISLPAALYLPGSVSIHHTFAAPADCGDVADALPHADPPLLKPILNNGEGSVTCKILLPPDGAIISALFHVAFTRILRDDEARMIAQAVRLAGVAIHTTVGALLRDEALSRTPPPDLKPRQAEVMSLIAEGMLDKEVAQHLGISVPTVRYHMNNAFETLGVKSRAEAIKMLMLWGRLRPV